MNQKISAATDDEVSLKDIINNIRIWIKYILSKWLIILIAAITGGTIGYFYTYKQIPVYTAVCTFILEGGAPANSPAFQGLPQLLGAQQRVGSQNDGGLLSLFQTNNYTALYKSRRILEQTLLSENDFNGEKELVIDYYLDLKKYRTDPATKAQFQNIDFHVSKEKFTTRHNIIMNMVVKDVQEIFTIKNAEAGPPVLSIEVQTPDSLLSKVLSEKILDAVNQFYIETKNYKARENIRLLEKNADSLKTALFRAMSGVASMQQQIPNVNTAYQTVKLPPQKKQIEVSFLQALYTTAASELATARNEMRGLQPFIIILDKPTYPLPVSEANITYGIVIGIVASVILTILVLILILLTKKLLS